MTQFFLRCCALLFLVTIQFSLLPTVALAWTRTMNFEGGTSGTLANGATAFDDAHSQTTFSNSLVHGGSMAARVNFVQGSDAWAESGGMVTFPANIPSGGQLWARGYLYFKSPWSWNSSPVVKVFRAAHVATSGGANVGYDSVFGQTGGGILLSNEPGDVQPSTSGSFDTDRWQSIEMYIKFSTTQPIFRIWKDGILIAQDTVTKTIGSASDVADFSYVFTYWNGGVPQNQVAYLDDFVYTTDTPTARDAANNPMIGPIGWGGAPDTTPPAAPTGLGVQ